MIIIFIIKNDNIIKTKNDKWATCTLHPEMSDSQMFGAK